MREEVRYLRQSAMSLALPHGIPGSADYVRTLEHLLDRWIRGSHGRRQLLCMACAAELHVLHVQHLALCYRNTARDSEPALNTLFWTIVRRYHARPAAVPHLKSVPLGPLRQEPVPLCEHCVTLQRDFRRASPHTTLRSVSHGESPRPADATDPAAQYHDGGWFRCVACDAHWIREFTPNDPFGAWTRAPASLSGTSFFHPLQSS